MGALCGGSQNSSQQELQDGDDASKQSIQNNPNNDNDPTVIKILFLGPGGSGKSTIFKQLKLRLTNSYEKVQNRQQEAQSIHAYIVDTIKHNLELIKHKSNNNNYSNKGHSSQISGDEIDSPYEVYFEDLSEAAQESAMYIHENIDASDSPRFDGKDDAMVKHIQTLWNEPKFRDIFKEN